MNYALVYTKTAVRDIEGLDAKTRTRIGKALLRFANAPLSYAEKLTNPNIGTYRFRIGDYRVIFDIHGAEVVVLRVGHRKEIYRKV